MFQENTIYFLEGKQTTDFIVKNLKHNQSKGCGFRSEILLEKNFDKYIFSMGPYINYWNIKDSARDYVFCRAC